VPSGPLEYLQMAQTMCKVFGTKWLKLHTGPGWSVVEIGQERTLADRGHCR